MTRAKITWPVRALLDRRRTRRLSPESITMIRPGWVARSMSCRTIARTAARPSLTSTKLKRKSRNILKSTTLSTRTRCRTNLGNSRTVFNREPWQTHPPNPDHKQ
uniref:(northern house mosquito) hypothetical protein n=1 Tax=Culex pipiens TaxID=7175 RepID=A0A8D8BIT9_CULPI